MISSVISDDSAWFYDTDDETDDDSPHKLSVVLQNHLDTISILRHLSYLAVAIVVANHQLIPLRHTNNYIDNIKETVNLLSVCYEVQ